MKINLSQRSTMSSAEYIQNGAHYCPCCGSDNISGGQFEAQDNEAYQLVSCNTCYSLWKEHFVRYYMEIEMNQNKKAEVEE